MVFLGIILCIVTYFTISQLIVKPILRRRHWNTVRAEIIDSPFPEELDTMLRKRFRLYHRLPEEIRKRVQLHARLLAAEKSFESAADLGPVTESMRILIMAQAALLTAGRNPSQLFPQLYSIIIYPTAYRDSGQRTFSSDEDPAHRLGESWNSGSIILAWDTVQRDAEQQHDGHNLVLHEFAHQLDQADGRADGAPILKSPEQYGDWAAVFQHRYQELVDDTEEGRKTLLDSYGATNPAEFFAVATETFFEQPRRMQAELPDLYEELRDYYLLDPAEWNDQD